MARYAAALELPASGLVRGWILDQLRAGSDSPVGTVDPTMPRPNLHEAQTLVRQFCADHDIAYYQCGLLRSYGHVLQHLHALGAALRAAKS